MPVVTVEDRVSPRSRAASAAAAAARACSNNLAYAPRRAAGWWTASWGKRSRGHGRGGLGAEAGGPADRAAGGGLLIRGRHRHDRRPGISRASFSFHSHNRHARRHSVPEVAVAVGAAVVQAGGCHLDLLQVAALEGAGEV